MTNNRILYGLVGYPLGHSFSKRYFTEKFATAGIDAEYLNFETESIDRVRDIIEQYPGLKGFNVTIPHKQDIIPLLDTVSKEAEEIGAVNCVKIEHTGNTVSLTGYNTDAYGFKKSLLQFIPAEITNALILGNGGAAKAVKYVLLSLGMNVLTVSRTPHREKEIGYTAIASLLNDYKLIVNTTPLGTWPNTENCPDIPYDLLTLEHYLFDLVYNPEITEYMKRGAAHRAHTQNGLEMLIGQAEKAWDIWTA